MKANPKSSKQDKIKDNAPENPLVETGIPGLDGLIGGGFPMESVVLLSGCAGTGKTIFSLQFLAEGALKYGERGLYVTFEERPEKIFDQAKRFGWDMQKLENEGMVQVISISKLTIGQIFSQLEEAIETFKPRRLALDSLTYFVLSARTLSKVVNLQEIPAEENIYGERTGIAASTEWDGIAIRKVMVDLVKLLQSKQICTIVTSEVSKNSEWYSRDMLSEFACDGVLVLKLLLIGKECHRTIEVVKLRNSPIKSGIYGFDFGKNGITIQP